MSIKTAAELYAQIDSPVTGITKKNLSPNEALNNLYNLNGTLKDIIDSYTAGLENASSAYAPTVLFVSPSGSDTNGTRGTIKAFLTIAAAKAAASAGDLIRILPGSFTITATLANNSGINYYLEDGAIINANTDELHVLGSETGAINYKISGSGSKNAGTINQLHANGRMMQLKDSGTGTIYMEGLILNDYRAGGSQVGCILDWSGGNTIYGKKLRVNCYVSGGWCIRYEDNTIPSTLVFEDCFFSGAGRAMQLGSSNASTAVYFRRCVFRNADNSADNNVIVGTATTFEDCRIYSNQSPNNVNILTNVTTTWVGTNIIYSPSGTNSLNNNTGGSNVDVKVFGNLLYNKPFGTGVGTINWPVTTGIEDTDVVYIPPTLY